MKDRSLLTIQKKARKIKVCVTVLAQLDSSAAAQRAAVKRVILVPASKVRECATPRKQKETRNNQQHEKKMV
jgi:hypothetical protein